MTENTDPSESENEGYSHESFTPKSKYPLPIFYMTDFGLKDTYVGQMKAKVASVSTFIPQYDLTHDIPPQNIRTANHVFMTNFIRLPHHYVLCGVVDPGVGTTRQSVIHDLQGHILIGPDNGLYTGFIGQDECRTYTIDIEKLYRLIRGCLGIIEYSCQPWDAESIRSFCCQEIDNKNSLYHRMTSDHLPLDLISNTFHGRDIFAPAAAVASLGLHSLILGDPVTDPVALTSDQIRFESNRTKLEIIDIDHFGNLIFDIYPVDLPKGITFEGEDKNKWRFIIGKTTVLGVHKTFGDVEIGDPVVYIGSIHKLELAIRNGNAADHFRLKIGDTIIAEYVP